MNKYQHLFSPIKIGTVEVPNRIALLPMGVFSSRMMNNDGSYTKDESVFKEKLTVFVKELASQYNSIGATRTFTGKDGQSHTVSGGTYGFRVSTDSEVSALLKMINENKSENNRTPEHTGQLPSGENGGLGTTYLEINITKQHLWLVKDGAVALESDFVSGKERIVSIKKQENPAISHLDCVTNLPEVACLCLKLNIWENYISILHTAVGLFYLL